MTTLIIVGGRGELVERKLYPALTRLEALGRLDYTKVVLLDIKPARDFAPLRAELVTQQADATDPGTWTAFDDDSVVYLAVEPKPFVAIAEAMRQAGFHPRRVAVEKPYGTDHENAETLLKILSDVVAVSELRLVDHFCLKPSLLTIERVRRSHAAFNGDWSRDTISSIDIRFPEPDPVNDDRLNFFDAVGTLIDVFQNHLLQTLCRLTARTAAGKLDILKALRRENLRISNAQYPGYRDAARAQGLKGDAETYVELETFIDTDQWRDVPITMLSGKATPGDARATVGFKPGVHHVESTALTFDLQSANYWLETEPTNGLATTLIPPENSHRGEDAYVEVLAQLLGDNRHFVTPEEALEQWRWAEAVRTLLQGL